MTSEIAIDLTVTGLYLLFKSSFRTERTTVAISNASMSSLLLTAVPIVVVYDHSQLVALEMTKMIAAGVNAVAKADEKYSGLGLDGFGTEKRNGIRLPCPRSPG